MHFVRKALSKAINKLGPNASETLSKIFLDTNYVAMIMAKEI